MLKGFRIVSLCLAVIVGCSALPMPQADDIILFIELPAPPPNLPPRVAMDDISSTAWYYQDIRNGFRRGYFRGDGGNFYPDRVLTRGEFFAMLGRLHESLGGSVFRGGGPSPFVDVEEDAFYAPYFTWAYDLGLIIADGQGQVHPHAQLNREDLALLLMLYLDSYHVHHHFDEIAEERGHFADRMEISSWARNAAHTLRDYGLILGVRAPGETDVYYFQPREAVTRRDIAVIFHRLFNAVFNARLAI